MNQMTDFDRTSPTMIVHDICADVDDLTATGILSTKYIVYTSGDKNFVRNVHTDKTVLDFDGDIKYANNEQLFFIETISPRGSCNSKSAVFNVDGVYGLLEHNDSIYVLCIYHKQLVLKRYNIHDDKATLMRSIEIHASMTSNHYSTFRFFGDYYGMIVCEDRVYIINYREMEIDCYLGKVIQETSPRFVDEKKYELGYSYVQKTKKLFINSNDKTGLMMYDFCTRKMHLQESSKLIQKDTCIGEPFRIKKCMSPKIYFDQINDQYVVMCHPRMLFLRTHTDYDNVTLAESECDIKMVGDDVMELYLSFWNEHTKCSEAFLREIKYVKEEYDPCITDLKMLHEIIRDAITSSKKFVTSRYYIEENVMHFVITVDLNYKKIAIDIKLPRRQT